MACLVFQRLYGGSLTIVWFSMVVILVVGMGCSTSDDCQRALAKVRPLVEDRARLHGELAPGQRMSEVEKDTKIRNLVEQCRSKRKLDPNDPMLTMKCLLAANDDNAVRGCVASAGER